VLRKRLVGVVTVRNGWAVQSFGYFRYLPLGKPECLIENLDRWGVDEIFIQEIDRSRHQLGPNLEMIGKIADCGISTPILYSGGVNSESDAAEAIRAGAERICVDNLLHADPDEVRNIANRLGSQAILASIPMVIDTDGKPGWYNYQSKQVTDFSKKLISLIDEYVISEVIVIDKSNEGTANSFNFDLLSAFSDKHIPLILFGGLSEADQMERSLYMKQVSAVAVGNFLNYREHAVQTLKHKLALTSIRPPFYQSNNFDC